MKYGDKKIIEKSSDLKIIELDILKYFKNICISNNLKYFLAYGTLLGAVRHSGFIPWDDDIDVMMPRNDYYRLCKILSKNNAKADYYELLSMHNNDIYFAPIAKLIDTRTILIQDYGQIEKPILGVYIDIFILDGFPDNKKESINIIDRANKNRFYWGLSVRKFSAKSKNLIIAIIKSLYSIPFRIIGYRYFLRKIDNIAKTYDYEISNYVGVICFGEGYKEIIEKKYIEPGIEILFEGEKYSAPSNIDKYLKNIYGDYLKIPPENERIPKHRNYIYWK